MPLVMKEYSMSLEDIMALTFDQWEVLADAAADNAKV